MKLEIERKSSDGNSYTLGRDDLSDGETYLPEGYSMDDVDFALVMFVGARRSGKSIVYNIVDLNSGELRTVSKDEKFRHVLAKIVVE